jgi:hypothetical protein
LRKTLLLPLDDLLAVTREFLCAEVSRSGLDRCLRRYGVGNLRALLPEQSQEPAKGFLVAVRIRFPEPALGVAGTHFQVQPARISQTQAFPAKRTGSVLALGLSQHGELLGNGCRFQTRTGEQAPNFDYFPYLFPGIFPRLVPAVNKLN